MNKILLLIFFALSQSAIAAGQGQHNPEREQRIANRQQKEQLKERINNLSPEERLEFRKRMMEMRNNPDAKQRREFLRERLKSEFGLGYEARQKIIQELEEEGQ